MNNDIQMFGSKIRYSIIFRLCMSSLFVETNIGDKISCRSYAYTIIIPNGIRPLKVPCIDFVSVELPEFIKPAIFDQL